MDNKKMGNDFEQELCEILADNGYWVHNFANRKNGQPADIIAVQGRLAFLIDAKVCMHNIFRLSRIEENQRYAMQAWFDAENGSPYFAIKLSNDDIYMITYQALLTAEQRGKKQLNKDDIKQYGISLDFWLKMLKSSF